MSTSKVLILDGHPGGRSLSRLFAETYAAAARAAGKTVRLVHLSDMSFDPDFGQGNYEAFKPLEPDLDAFMKDLQWADHFVLAMPMWWGQMPARLKGLVDRAFLPGLAFDTRTTKMGMPAPMLTGRTAQLIVTADTPMWALRMLYHRSVLFAVQGQVLKFVGLKPHRPLWFAGASKADPARVQRWVDRVERRARATA